MTNYTRESETGAKRLLKVLYLLNASRRVEMGGIINERTSKTIHQVEATNYKALATLEVNRIVAAMRTEMELSSWLPGTLKWMVLICSRDGLPLLRVRVCFWLHRFLVLVSSGKLSFFDPLGASARPTFRSRIHYHRPDMKCSFARMHRA